MGFRSFPRSSHAAHLPPRPNVRELDYFLNLNDAFEGDSEVFHHQYIFAISIRAMDHIEENAIDTIRQK